MRTTLCLSIALSMLAPAAAAAQPSAPAWNWVDEPDLYPMVALRAKVRHTEYVLGEVTVGKNESHAELRRELVKGGHRQLVWKVTIADKRWTDLVGGAMVVSGDTVYVARYNRIASTCTLRAFDTADGSERWSVTLHGVGPVAHSKWFNRVQLAIHRGHPVAYGNEGPGMGYVEVRDAATGTLIANQAHKVGGRPEVLAEPLYRELANMLAKSPSYQVSPSAFAGRHNLTFASKAARVRAFREAAAKLDGLPFGKHVMRVKMVKDKRGVLVIQATRR